MENSNPAIMPEQYYVQQLTKKAKRNYSKSGHEIKTEIVDSVGTKKGAICHSCGRSICCHPINDKGVLLGGEKTYIHHSAIPEIILKKLPIRATTSRVREFVLNLKKKKEWKFWTIKKS